MDIDPVGDSGALDVFGSTPVAQCYYLFINIQQVSLSLTCNVVIPRM